MTVILVLLASIAGVAIISNFLVYRKQEEEFKIEGRKRAIEDSLIEDEKGVIRDFYLQLGINLEFEDPELQAFYLDDLRKCSLRPDYDGSIAFGRNVKVGRGFYPKLGCHSSN